MCRYKPSLRSPLNTNDKSYDTYKPDLLSQNSIRSAKIVPIPSKKRSISPKFDDLNQRFDNVQLKYQQRKNWFQTSRKVHTATLKNEVRPTSASLYTGTQFRDLKINTRKYKPSEGNQKPPLSGMQVERRDKSRGVALAQLKTGSNERPILLKDSSKGLSSPNSAPFACLSNRNNPKRFTKEIVLQKNKS